MIEINTCRLNMFFILKLILMILLNDTYAYVTQDSEIILLPARYFTDAKEISLTLKTFGKQIQLNLRRNNHNVSSEFEVWKLNTKGITEKLSQLNALDPCYYLHQDHISTAAINLCQEHGLEGIIYLENATLEIIPISNNLASPFIGDSCVKMETNVSFGKPHLIKRSLKYLADSDPFYVNNHKLKRRHLQNTQNSLTIEMAVFFDEIAYSSISSTSDEHENEIRNMLLAYVNGIQAVFHHPSLGVPINISLIYMEIMKVQPIDMPHFDGDAFKLLNSFCNYTKMFKDFYKQLKDSRSAHHWDVSLYITALDLYTIMWNGKKSFTISSLSTINNSCTELSCAVVEFGVIRDTVNPLVSTGFGSIYYAVYEIGRILGMMNDSEYNITECSDDRYIMSPEQGFRSRVWSVCSRRIAKKLSQTKQCLLDTLNISEVYSVTHELGSIKYRSFNRLDYNDDIKKEWTAKKQCELFMRNENANVVTLHDACKSLQCELEVECYFFDEEKLFFAGPALDGTHCAPGQECHNGECVSIFQPDISDISDHSEEGSWSEWEEDSCSSHCLEKSKGVRAKRRFCRDKNNKTANCKGPSYDVTLCDDSTICTEGRMRIDNFIADKCESFSFYTPLMDVYNYNNVTALRIAHIDEVPWIACSIFCRKKDKEEVFSYFSPRKQMIDNGISPYMLDGTWCHAENGQDYFCRKHYCLPEDYTNPEVY